MKLPPGGYRSPKECDSCGKIPEGPSVIYNEFVFCSDNCKDKFLDENGGMFVCCEQCGNGEEIPVNEQRWHTQSFEWLENTDEVEPNTARYKCLVCGCTDCRSTFTLDSRAEIEDRKIADGGKP